MMKRSMLCMVILILISFCVMGQDNTDETIKKEPKTLAKDIINKNKDKFSLAILNDKHDSLITLKLQELYIKTESKDSKREILESIKLYGDKSNVPFLLLLLKAEEKDLHKDIIEGIEFLSSTHIAAGSLAAALGYKNSIGLKFAVKPLLEYANNKDNGIQNRAAAISALAHIPSSRELVPLATSLIRKWEKENHEEINKAINDLRNPPNKSMNRDKQ